ncbi:MAG: PQQ-binding-like beta-propeller repeat protein [Planctomycetota bacterium]
MGKPCCLFSIPKHRLKLVFGFVLIATCLFITNLFSASNNSYVDFETDEVNDYLKTASEYESKKQWREAIECYEFLAKKYPDALCQVDSDCYTGIKQYYLRRLQSYPDEGRQVYKDMFDSASQLEFRNALAQFRQYGDINPVIRITKTEPFGFGSIDASILAGDYFAEYNQYDKAIKYYRLAIENARWRNQSQDQVEARLKQCINLRDTLPQVMVTDWFKYGGNNANNFVFSDKSLPVNPALELSWYCPFGNMQSLFSGGRKKIDNHSKDSVSAAEILQTPLYYPVMADGKAYINTGLFIVSFEIASGKVGAFFSSGMTRGQPNYVISKSNNVNTIIANTNAYKILYATMPIQSGLGRLVALKIPELKELWESEIELNEGNISGPLFYDGKIYLCGFFNNNNEWQFCLFCYEAYTGRLIYKKNIYSLSRASKNIRNSLMMAPRIAEYKGFIYTLTQPVAAAINAEDGEIIWVNDYNTTEIMQLSNGYYGFTNQITYLSYIFPLIKDETVVVQSTYSGKVLGFDVFSGRVKWQQTINSSRATLTPVYRNQGRQVSEIIPWAESVSAIGCAGDAVLIQGEDLTAINLGNGKLVWETSIESILKLLPSQGSAGAIIGQGFVTDHYVYFPIERGIVIQNILIGKTGTIILKLSEVIAQTGDSDRMILYRISDGVMVASDKGVWFYRIK